MIPLGEPPVGAGALVDCPRQPLAGRTLHRVWRAVLADGTLRVDPWWLASAPEDRPAGGRFDLPAPMGTCYLAATPVGALLEAFQAHLTALPASELRSRRIARLRAPEGAPPGARLTSRLLAGRHGVTAALWAGSDRALTQRWAAAFRRDGWWALYGGLQHDPTGRLRGWALFDHAGAHPPTTAGGWTCEDTALGDDVGLHRQLARFGITVREPGDLPFRKPPA